MLLLRMVSAEPCGIKLHLESSTMIGAVARMLLQVTEALLSPAAHSAATMFSITIGTGLCFGGECMTADVHYRLSITD